MNITTNPHAFSCATAPLLIDPYNSSSASSSAESTHQRWTQKLCQLRQVSPAATLLSSVHQQKVAIEATAHVATAEPELVALAINESSSSSDRADFEIVRRVSLNRATLPATGGSASSSPGSSSDNFLHSLQSLATTCLRGSSPSMESNYRYTSLATSPMVSPAATPKYAYQRSTPPRFQNPYTMDATGSASSSGSGIQSPRASWTPTLGTAHSSSTSCSSTKEKYLHQMSGRIPIPTATFTSASASLPMATKITTTTTTSTSNPTSTYPQQGPHCDQFLRKMGLAKTINAETAESEEHICDMSYVNITCSRWRAYCLKMEAIIARGEPVCIEVYLGPLSHRILLEQWIISQKEKVPPPTMTLPSLCSAIRSQLYFSQISAWCDLIKKSDQTIYENGRVIFPTPTVAAGDLATHDGTPTGTSPHAAVAGSPLNQLTNAMLNRRPRLNIFYRIKQYDSTACFNSKPNVHNFPNVNISENSISICLKSLPRINGGIPKVGSSMSRSGDCPAAAANGAKKTCSSMALAATAETPKTSRSAAAPTSYSSNCDNKDGDGVAIGAAAAISGRHKCMFFIDEEELEDPDVKAIDLDTDGGEDESDLGNGAGDSSNSSFSSNVNISHRDKQLLKYRKRMLRRDKKHRKPNLSTGVETGELVSTKQQQQQQQQQQRQRESEQRSGDNSAYQPMEQCEKEQLTPTQQHRRSPTPTAQHGQVEMISTGTQTSTVCCQQCGSEKALICISCHNGGGDCSAAELDDSMDSGSSISSSDIITTPRNKAELLLQAIQRTPKVAKHKKQAMRLRIADGVAERTAQLQELQNNNHLNAVVVPLASSNGTPLRAEGCHVCKRQKTQHNFGLHANLHDDGTGRDDEGIVDEHDEDDEDDGKSVCENFNLAMFTSPLKIEAVSQVMEDESEDQTKEETSISSTKLTPHIKRFSLSSKCAFCPNDDQNSTLICCTPPDRESVHPAEFKTPTNGHHQQQEQSQQSKPYEHKHTPKPNLLKILCSGSDVLDNGNNSHNLSTLRTESNLPTRKLLPKINLTPIFCNPSTSLSHSAPIPINGRSTSESGTFSFEPSNLSRTNGQQQLFGGESGANDSNIPVQKSFSAPTLPNSPSLSPRFAKQAAIYKRRTRHLSDRSDRSSLGSDEQFSDEELDGVLYSPATSPLKNRTRLAALHGRLPLFGNLEESLLQKRILPKIEVMGFKVLLGASGGFCPTQLTIPAAAWFYELQGEALSTPYMCEIRLPRKGYSVPRVGNVQVTLLNPMGTVVRMFVVPYDMRDMPPLHQTFIRQRILAEASTNETVTLQNNNNNHSSATNILNGSISTTTNNNNNTHNNNNNNNNNNNIHKYRISPSGGLHGESNLGHFMSPEHMKRLRYSIHLRFQTSRSGRLSLHTDIRLLISRRTDCDTAAAHAKGVLEAPNDLVTDTVMPTQPKYSARQESPGKI